MHASKSISKSMFFAKPGFWFEFMTIWGFMLEHVGHILGFKSTSKSIPELDIHHGGPMGASGRPLGTSGGRSLTPKSKGPWSLRAGVRLYPPFVELQVGRNLVTSCWDEVLGGPYMSFGQSIISHSLVAP